MFHFFFYHHTPAVGDAGLQRKVSIGLYGCDRFINHPARISYIISPGQSEEVCQRDITVTRVHCQAMTIHKTTC